MEITSEIDAQTHVQVKHIVLTDIEALYKRIQICVNDREKKTKQEDNLKNST